MVYPTFLTSLPFSISSHPLQDIHPCLSFVGWHYSCVPRWPMYAGYRRWPASSAVCRQSNVLGQEITQPVRWSLFCHRRANAVEQSAWTASATGHHLRTIQTIVENVYVCLVGLRRPVSER